MNESNNESKKIISFLIPSIADVIFICTLLFLSFFAGKGLLNDGDTGYHIRAGEYILETLSIPRQDIFSFLSPPLPWTAHEWLSEVVMAVIHRVFGLSGIVVFFSIIISLVYYLLFKIIKTKKDYIIPTVFIVLLVLLSSGIHWLARPHIFSLLFTLIWYYLLDQYQYEKKNYLYFLPPIMLLWVNLHGGFLAGFILLGIYLFSNVVNFITSKGVDRDTYKKRAIYFGLITVVCLFVSLINPFGYRLLLVPFNLVSNKFIMDIVSEFQSPNFHLPNAYPFKYFLLLMIVIFAISKVKIKLIEILLVLMFTNMSLYSARYIPLFSIIVAPILLRQFRPVLEQSGGRFVKFIKKRSDSISETDESARGYLWPVVAVILIVILASAGKIDFKFSEKRAAVAAVEFLKNEHIKGRMFNNDEIGDYIIYAAWPKYKVCVDGRSLVYGTDIMKEYMELARVKPGWEKTLEKYNFSWIIYNANTPLSILLMQRDDWKLIYADKVANIFVKDIPENQYLIEKYPDVELVVDEDEDE